LLQRERVAGDGERAPRGPALGAVTAEGGRRLRREADVPHDGNPGLDDRAGALDAGPAAFQLDRVAPRLLDEPLGGRDRLGVTSLVRPERKVTDQQRGI